MLLNIACKKMYKTKSHKHGLSLFNFQICRPKSTSAMIRSPLPALSYMYSPVNSKTFDISFPSFPEPPTPSTVTPVEHEFTSTDEEKECNSTFYKETDWQVSPSKRETETHRNTREKNTFSGVSARVSTSHDKEIDWQVSPSKGETKTHRNTRKKSTFSGESARVSTSHDKETDWQVSHSKGETKTHRNIRMKNTFSGDSARVSTSHDNETDWQVSPSKGEKKTHRYTRKKSTLSGESARLFTSHDSNHPTNEEGGSKKVPLKQKKAKTERFKRYGSKEWKGGEYQDQKRVGPCMVDHEKVNESFVVVKKSANPYEDFKRSMSEMIFEKQIFEPKELEELLMSFLSLNSRLHHKVIIEAFAEVLEEVFCG